MAQQQVAMVLQAWEEWEGRVVAGKFALGRYVGGGERSAIYETDLAGLRAAVKMVAGGSDDGQAQLVRWELARKLNHPHLLRVFETGFWHANEEQDMLFAVMEFGDENLAEVLGDRALSAEEVRGMLPPVLDVLAFLHGRDLVYGCVKPSSVFAVGNQVKLAVDDIQHVSDRRPYVVSDRYAAPELASEGLSPKSDVWSLGLTVFEVLTRNLPRASGEADAKVVAELAEPFASIVAACLQREPAKRASVEELRAMLERPMTAKKAPVAPVRAEEKPTKESLVTSEAVVGKDGGLTDGQRPSSGAPAAILPMKTAEAPTSEPNDAGRADFSWHSVAGSDSFTGVSEGSGSRRMILIGALIFAVIVVALVLGLWHRSAAPSTAGVGPSTSGERAAATVQQPVPAESVTPAQQHGAVLRQVMPEVSRAARNTIHGTVKVTVLADVNAAGQVSDAKLQSRGSSKYFGKAALEAARRWIFTAPAVGGRPVASRWSLRFEFKRSGDKASAQAVAPKI